jgi:hypothetical protein
MHAFEVIYEDPDYTTTCSQDIYLEPGSVKDFAQWQLPAQLRLIEDIYSPFSTINS